MRRAVALGRGSPNADFLRTRPHPAVRGCPASSSSSQLHRVKRLYSGIIFAAQNTSSRPEPLGPLCSTGRWGDAGWPSWEPRPHAAGRLSHRGAPGGRALQRAQERQPDPFSWGLAASSQSPLTGSCRADSFGDRVLCFQVVSQARRGPCAEVSWVGELSEISLLFKPGVAAWPPTNQWGAEPLGEARGCSVASCGLGQAPRHQRGVDTTPPSQAPAIHSEGDLP